jgi:plasmid stabilization system protein ParE
MAFRVEIAPQAIADIDSIVATLRRAAPKAAREWLNGIEAAIATLTDMPARCPLAPENDYFRVEIRQFCTGAIASCSRLPARMKSGSCMCGMRPGRC